MEVCLFFLLLFVLNYLQKYWQPSKEWAKMSGKNTNYAQQFNIFTEEKNVQVFFSN